MAHEAVPTTPDQPTIGTLGAQEISILRGGGFRPAEDPQALAQFHAQVEAARAAAAAEDQPEPIC